MPKIIEIH